MTTRDSLIGVLSVLVMRAKDGAAAAGRAARSPGATPAGRVTRGGHATGGGCESAFYSGNALRTGAAAERRRIHRRAGAPRRVLRARPRRHGARFMRDNARWIVENPGYLVLIEGHTDYKGSPGFNLPMAERRAKTAADFLLKEGVAETRLWTVSHGSDRPVCAKKPTSARRRSGVCTFV